MSSIGKIITITNKEPSSKSIKKATKLFAKTIHSDKFNKFKDNYEWFFANLERLRKEIPDHYVAIHEKHVCHSDTAMNKLIKYVRDHYGYDQDVVIEYISKEKPKLVL